MKRTFDVVVATVGLVVTSPLVALGAVAVKLESPGPAFYRSARVGRGGQPFDMYKLRTMRVNADREGPAVTGARDPRVTSVGRFLRRTKMDELPQLLNVLLGDMSLVGPRPEAPDFVRYYTPEQQRVLSVRPGMTGPAAIAYIDEEQMLGETDAEARYIKSVMPQKLAIDLEYMQSSSFAGDLKILARTIWLIVRR
jgi:lipopolysaccharide/colanic/teichoic acid biosynthesis glycosyltransferase